MTVLFGYETVTISYKFTCRLSHVESKLFSLTIYVSSFHFKFYIESIFSIDPGWGENRKRGIRLALLVISNKFLQLHRIRKKKEIEMRIKIFSNKTYNIIIVKFYKQFSLTYIN